jgi:hypothetical protein
MNKPIELPDILSIIVSFLDDYDVRSFILVNKMWYNIGTDNENWKKRYQSIAKHYNETIISLYNRYPSTSMKYPPHIDYPQIPPASVGANCYQLYVSLRKKKNVLTSFEKRVQRKFMVYRLCCLFFTNNFALVVGLVILLSLGFCMLGIGVVAINATLVRPSIYYYYDAPTTYMITSQSINNSTVCYYNSISWCTTCTNASQYRSCSLVWTDLSYQGFGNETCCDIKGCCVYQLCDCSACQYSKFGNLPDYNQCLEDQCTCTCLQEAILRKEVICHQKYDPKVTFTDVNGDLDGSDSAACGSNITCATEWLDKRSVGYSWNGTYSAFYDSTGLKKQPKYESRDVREMVGFWTPFSLVAVGFILIGIWMLPSLICRCILRV